MTGFKPGAQVQMIGDARNVYQDAALSSPIVAELDFGSWIELGATVRRQGLRWVEISTPDGKRGYILEGAQFFRPMSARLIQDSVDIYEDPSYLSPVKYSLKQNSQFRVESALKAHDVLWFKVRDASGRESFIPGDTLLSEDVEQRLQASLGGVLGFTAVLAGLCGGPGVYLYLIGYQAVGAVLSVIAGLCSLVFLGPQDFWKLCLGLLSLFACSYLVAALLDSVLRIPWK